MNMRFQLVDVHQHDNVDDDDADGFDAAAGAEYDAVNADAPAGDDDNVNHCGDCDNCVVDDDSKNDDADRNDGSDDNDDGGDAC